MQSLARLADRASCLLVVLTAAVEADRELLVEIRRRFPTKPMIALATMSPSSIDALAPVIVDRSIRVVWDSALPEALDAALHEGLQRNPLWHLHEFVRDVVQPPPLVEQVVRVVCTSSAPPRTVRDLEGC